MTEQKSRRTARPAAVKPSEAAERRAAFAREMARSVLGRYYWDARQQAELERALRRDPKAKP